MASWSLDMTLKDVALSTRQLEEIIRAQTSIARLGLNFEAILDQVASKTQELTHASGAVIELIEGDETVVQAASGTAQCVLGLRRAKANNLSSVAINTGQPLYSDDTENDPRVDQSSRSVIGHRSMIVFPLFYEDKVVGVIKVLSSSPHFFTNKEVKILSFMSDLVASAMYYAKRYSEDELFRQATRDELTGLANRGLFMEHLHQNLSRAKREHSKVGIIAIDMDGLKSLNDTYGHQIGDLALKTLAKRFSKLLRRSDTFARFGGDEFAVILSPIANKGAGQKVIENLTSSLHKPLRVDDKELNLSASFGLALFPDDGSDGLKLLQLADERMFESKRLANKARR